MVMEKIPAPTFRVFQKFEETSKREGLFPEKGVVIAGVSGGVDSMLLLAFLKRVSKSIPFHLTACHLDHQIRGEEARLDRELVKSFCEAASIPLQIFSVDIPLYAAKMKMGLEEAGRIKRRELFEKAGEEQLKILNLVGEYRIALAHHMDDRAESILMHIGRGTGLRGLVGIRYIDGPYIRPLLDIRRSEVEEAASALGLPWRDDRSNVSDEFLRNRIRNQLIPAWEETVGYDPTPLIVRLGDLAFHDDEALEELATESFRKALLPDFSLSVSSLMSLPYALYSRVIQLFYLTMAEPQEGKKRAPRELTTMQLETLRRLSEDIQSGKQTRAQLSWPGGSVVTIAEGRIWLSWPDKTNE